MSRTLATMVTMTTYGSWLRGDRRGWVDGGRVMPAAPRLAAADARRMKHEPFAFAGDDLLPVGAMLGESLTTRKRVPLLALTVSTWHVHFVIGPTRHDIGDVVKCSKDAVRYGLRPGRPVWTAGYDKRFCFDAATVRNRVRYVERHNVARGWPAQPWPFRVGYPT